MKKGGPCPWPVAKCPVPAHADWRDRTGLPLEPAQTSAPMADEQAIPESPGWLNGKDLRGLGWWLIERVLWGRIETQQASVVASLMRTLAALGPEEASEEEALREVELRGRLMHGQPPRTEEEWARARAAFDEDALAEFRRWASLLLLEGDRGDGPEPFDLGQRRAGHVHVPLLVDDEDGV